MDNKKLHIVAVTGIIEKNGRFLIIKRREDEVAYPGMWTVPGGKVETPDDCQTTLRREIKEEVGVEIKDEIVFIRDYGFTRPDDIHVIGLTFGCKYKSGKVKLSPDFTDFAWVTAKEAENYKIIPGILQELQAFSSRNFKNST